MEREDGNVARVDRAAPHERRIASDEIEEELQGVRPSLQDRHQDASAG